MKNLFLVAFISLSFFSNAQFKREIFNIQDSITETTIEKDESIHFKFNKERSQSVIGDTLYWIFYDVDGNLTLNEELIIVNKYRIGEHSLYLLKHTSDGYHQLFALKEVKRNKEALVLWGDLKYRYTGNINY